MNLFRFKSVKNQSDSFRFNPDDRRYADRQIDRQKDNKTDTQIDTFLKTVFFFNIQDTKFMNIQDIEQLNEKNTDKSKKKNDSTSQSLFDEIIKSTCAHYIHIIVSTLILQMIFLIAKEIRTKAYLLKVMTPLWIPMLSALVLCGNLNPYEMKHRIAVRSDNSKMFIIRKKKFFKNKLQKGE